MRFVVPRGARVERLEGCNWRMGCDAADGRVVAGSTDRDGTVSGRVVRKPGRWPAEKYAGFWDVHDEFLEALEGRVVLAH